MTCLEAQSNIMAFIEKKLPDDVIPDFVKHMRYCKNCREELEIYFTVDVGIRQLDQETGTYNIKGALETALELSRQRVHTLGILETARYAVNTLCFWAVLAVLVLQFRMW